MLNKIDNYNVYAYIMLSEDLYTPKIELKSDIDTLASFIVQAVSDKNYGVRIVDGLDLHICDVELVDMVIFKELRFHYSRNVKDLGYKANQLFEKYCENPNLEFDDCTIQNIDYWKDFVNFEDVEVNDSTLKADFNSRVFSNFK